jgi:hypothetical protein
MPLAPRAPGLVRVTTGWHSASLLALPLGCRSNGASRSSAADARSRERCRQLARQGQRRQGGRQQVLAYFVVSHALRLQQLSGGGAALRLLARRQRHGQLLAARPIPHTAWRQRLSTCPLPVFQISRIAIALCCGRVNPAHRRPYFTQGAEQGATGGSCHLQRRRQQHSIGHTGRYRPLKLSVQAPCCASLPCFVEAPKPSYVNHGPCGASRL